MTKKSVLVGIFFGLLVVVGLVVFRDYGISWDAPIQRKYGLDVYNYVFQGDTKLLTNKDRYYGPAMEFSHVFIEKLMGIGDPRIVYQARHLFNFLVFALGVFFFYLLLVKRFKNYWWGLLGSLMLVLSPRIFAHSFYNSKDIAFMSLFIIAAYVSLKFSENKSTWMALFAALATALLIDVRIMGVLLPLILVDVFFLHEHGERNKKILWLYLLFTAVFVLIFWPTLWRSPISNFLAAFKQMGNYPQKTNILYFGKNISSFEVPWHYTLGWIGATIPISYLVLAIAGVWAFLQKVNRILREDVLMFSWLVISLAAVIIFKSNLYDAWRQMFFIYPAILYFAIYGLYKASKKTQKLFLVLVGINMIFVTFFMINNHPYQNLYFNELVRPPYEKHFSLDYWGLSYKGGLEHIAEVDTRSLIKIAVENLPGENNLLMLSPEDRERFEVVEDANLADYYLTNYRRYKDLYYDSAFYTVEVLGTRILGVHRLK